jgi:hypothetical protein
MFSRIVLVQLEHAQDTKEIAPHGYAVFERQTDMPAEDASQCDP